MQQLDENPYGPQDDAIDLSELVLQHEWSVYQDLIEAAAWQNLRFCLGGGLAFSSYSKRQRDMKDIDLFILKEDRQAFIDLLNAMGYADYFDKEPYDQTWIYRGHLVDRVVLDLIWTLPNHRVDVEADWFERGKLAAVYGQRFRLIPPEDVIRTKIYVLQRDGCHWPDLLNILEHLGPSLDWEYLIPKMGADVRLLGALVATFAWLCPKVAAEFPPDVWGRMGLTAPEEKATDEDRARLLDTREWFGGGREEANEL